MTARRPDESEAAAQQAKYRGQREATEKARRAERIAAAKTRDALLGSLEGIDPTLGAEEHLRRMQEAEVAKKRAAWVSKISPSGN